MDFKHPWLNGSCVRLKFARSQIFANWSFCQALILLFLRSLGRAAFWSCSSKCIETLIAYRNFSICFFKAPFCHFLLVLGLQLRFYLEI